MKQRQNNQSTDKVPCAWCQRIRILISLLILAAAMLAVNGELPFLIGVSLTRIAAELVGVGFIILIIWKTYYEYWKPRNVRNNKKP